MKVSIKLDLTDISAADMVLLIEQGIISTKEVRAFYPFHLDFTDIVWSALRTEEKQAELNMEGTKVTNKAG